MTILDFLFPKRCVICKKQGDYLCENCFAYLSFDTNCICLVCIRRSIDGLTHKQCLGKYSIDGCISALKYNRTMQKLLYSFKNKPYLSDLKNLLGELFYESIIQNETFTKELKRKNWVFVPVSLSKEKLRKRGYNQSEILAKYLGEKLKIQVEKKEFLGKNVFLIDDLIVRGETVGDAAKALKKAGAKRVIALVLVGK